MNWFLNLSTKIKLFFAFSLMMLLVGTMILAAQRGISAIQESQHRLYEVDFANAMDLLTFESNQNGARTAQLMMMALTRRADQELWHQDVKERAKQNDEILVRLLDRNRDDPNLLRRLEELRTIRTAFLHTRDTQTIPLIYQGKIEEAKKVALGIQVERFDKMRALAGELGKNSVSQAQRRIAESERKANAAARLFAVVGLAAIAGCLVLTLLLNRVIAAPLQNISAVAAGVAAGDLTVRVPEVRRSDEVGVLADTFRRMLESLRRMTVEIRDGVNVLGTSASEIL
ncbi:MAG TPA: methyl-accepting chemotaxis protein, partial [Gemmatimonadales bacterium]|nr:methyl-accepting chemotaxis protein [Gemmatimonadales bacterium]